MNKLLLSTLVSFLIFAGITSFAFAEELFLFANQNLMDLTLVATDPENGTFSFLDKTGEMQEGIIGDVIGIEEAKVHEVLDLSIVVVTYEEYEGQNWDDTSITRTRTNVHTIPMARMLKGGKGVR